MVNFNIKPLDRFVGQSTTIRRPSQIGQFSYDDEHNYHADASSLRYYYPPTLGANLSIGFDTFKKLDDTRDDHLDALLKTIMDLERKAQKICGVDFITWRGMMTKIMTAPFGRFNSFEMRATYFQGTIFIEEDHAAKLAQREDDHRRTNTQPKTLISSEEMSYWGYKFETISTLPDIWDNCPRDYIENRENEIVNNHAQYCSIVQTGIGNATIVIGGEVDAVWDSIPDDSTEPINWVELKTHATIQSDADQLKFERKLLRMWAQSFLLGVPKIIVGFRSQDGILTRLEEIATQSIPGNVKKIGKKSWDGNVCINFTAAFLDFLKRIITSEGVWRLRQREGSSIIEIIKVEETGHGNIISDEFLDWRKQYHMSNIMSKLGSTRPDTHIDS